MEIRNVLDQLNLSLQITLQLLTDLENAIVFAKTNTLYNNIIQPTEMNTIIQTMARHHTTSQLFYTKPEDFRKYYDLITVDAYYSNAIIVFVLHFPLLHPEKFTHFHLYSIPTSNFTTIIPPAPYLTLNTGLHHYSQRPCKKINPGFLCQIPIIRGDIQPRDCISQILHISEDEARCQQVPVSIKGTLIEEITPAHYVGIFPKPTKISTECSTPGMQELHGTYLIEVPPGCGFETPEANYINSKGFTYEQPLALPKVRTISIPHEKKMLPIQLEKIPLDELHKIHEQSLLQPLGFEDIPVDSTHFWTTPVFIIATAVIGILVFKFRHTLRCQRISETPPVPATRTQVLFHPHKTSSGDGEVTI
nr:uncharacterized protein LOC111514882 [Leptinotarsa decemlineata]